MIRGSTEESRERKIALFWTLVYAHENARPITQEEIVASLMIDEYPVTTRVPKRKLAYDGNDNAFRQKFERDKAAIRDLGFEISTTKTLFDVDGYSIDPTSVFVPAIDFGTDEFALVSWATRLLGIGTSGVGRLFADGPTPDGGVEFSPILQPLTRAAGSRRVVRFKYRKGSEKPREREIAPLEFLYWHGQSYVIGVEIRSEKVKGFRISRFQSTPTITSDSFTATAEQRVSAAAWVPAGRGDGEHLTARFVTTKAFAQLLLTDYPHAAIDDSRGAEAVEVEIEFNSASDACRAVLALGDRIRTVRPKSLRDDVVSWLKGVNRPTNLKGEAKFESAGARVDTLGQTMQLIAAVYQSPNPLRASELAERCHLEVELVRSVMSRLMAMQYLRDPTKYLVHIEPADDLDDEEAPEDPQYRRSSSYDDGLGATLAALTWRDAYELLVSLNEAASLYPSEVIKRVISKIERVVQANVRVMEVEHEFLSAVRDAIDQRQQLKVTYWSAASDEVAERCIEPRAMASRNGRWYLRAWCTTRQSWLTFRADRILHIHAVELSPGNREEDPVANWADLPGEEGSVVTVVLPPEQRWLFEPLPTLEWGSIEGELEVVRLRVRDDRFLAQLMVEAGPGAFVLDGGDPKAGRDLAQRMMSQL